MTETHTKTLEATEGGHSCPPNGGLANQTAGWEMALIGDLTLRTKQRNPGRDPEKRFSYVDVSSVSNTSFRITVPTELPGAQAPSRARKVIRAGDVLFATVRPTLKRVALVPEELDDQIASTGFIVLRADVSRLDSGYLYYRLLTDEFIERMRELERGASYPAVRDSDICNEQIPLPPLAEQRKIAEVLGLVQRALEQQERLIALTTELKKALLHQLFTHGLRGEPQEQTEIGPVPESWEVVRLGNYCSLQGGFAFKSDDYVPAESGIPIIKIGDLQDGEVMLSERSSFVPTSFWDQKSARSFQLKRGDLLIALTGATTGKTAEFQLDGRAFLNQRVGRFLPNEQSLKPGFLKHLVPQTYFQREIQQNILAAAQGNISPKCIEQFLVGVPSLDGQEQIGNILGTLDAKISVTRRKHAALTALFRTLLHQLMTAQIRVHDLDLDGILGQTVPENENHP